MATARWFLCLAAILLAWTRQAPGQGATAPEIVQQPEDAVVDCAGGGASFFVGAAGTDLAYQWFSNNVALSNQTLHTLALATTTTNMDGTLFHVVVSNSISSVTSRAARLTVHPDTCGPMLLKAVSMDIQGLTNRVSLTFDEPIDANSGRIISNYTISIAGQTNIVPVTTVNVAGLRVFLVLGTNLFRTNDYFLSLTGISDARRNNIAPFTKVPVLFTYSNFVFGMSQPWTFYDGALDCSALPGDWMMPSYEEDQRWGRPEAGIFWKFSSSAPPVPCTGSFPEFSELSVGCTNHYFRTRFTVTPDLITDAALRLQHFIDDGAVFYLNGIEVARYNMPAGAVNSTTTATTNVAAACVVTVVPVTNLIAGENLLAVDVRQASADRFAVAFGTQLAILTDQGPSLPQPSQPALALERVGTDLNISWPLDSPNFRLMCAEGLDGPWREAQPLMSNPWFTSATKAQAFYRLEWIRR